MAKKFGCLNFPFHEDTVNQSLLHTTSVNNTIASSIRAFSCTSPGQRRGNNIGSFLPTLKHQLLSKEALVVASDKYKQELAIQFPGVTFNSVNLIQTIENEGQAISLTALIEFVTNFSDVEQLRFTI